jgi:hypothetical protein
VQKTTILKGYSIDESRYKQVCSVLEVDESNIFPLCMIEDFEEVLGWFNADKGLNVKSAITRYQELKASRPKGISEAVGAALEASRERIEYEVAEVYGQTEAIVSDIKQQFISGIYAIAGNVLLREAQKMRVTPAYPGFAPASDTVQLPPSAKDGDG